MSSRRRTRGDENAASDPPGLSPRLAAVAELVPCEARVVDIASGHGLLPQWLLACRRARACIATERDRQAAGRLRRPGRASGVEIRVGDGLDALEPGDDVDVLVMAGLGARSMLRILSAGVFDVGALHRLVLQPQTESGLLRRWLVERGRAIIDERLVVDRGRFYVVIAAEPANGTERPAHPRLGFDDLMEAGPCLVRSGGPVVLRYWRRTADRLEGVLALSTTGTGRARARRGRDLARRVLAALEHEKGGRLL